MWCLWGETTCVGESSFSLVPGMRSVLGLVTNCDGWGTRSSVGGGRVGGGGGRGARPHRARRARAGPPGVVFDHHRSPRGAAAPPSSVHPLTVPGERAGVPGGRGGKITRMEGDTEIQTRG